MVMASNCRGRGRYKSLNEKTITLNTWRTLRNSFRNNGNEVINNDQTQNMYTAVQLWSLSPGHWRWTVNFILETLPFSSQNTLPSFVYDKKKGINLW